MHIDITYLIVSLLSLFLGFFLGRRYGIHVGRVDLMRTGLSVKNPEMWELLHFLVVDEAEKKKDRTATEIIKKASGSKP